MLAAHDDLPGAPVEIIQRQARRPRHARSPSRASSISTAKSRRPTTRRAIATGKQRPHLPGLQPLRQARQPPAARRRHRVRERPARSAPSACRNRSSDRNAFVVRFAELRDCDGHVSTTNATTAAPSSRASSTPVPASEPLQERPDVDRVPTRGLRQHPALEDHEPLDSTRAAPPPAPPVAGGHAGRDDTHPAQIRQQRLRGPGAQYFV